MLKPRAGPQTHQLIAALVNNLIDHNKPPVYVV